MLLKLFTPHKNAWSYTRFLEQIGQVVQEGLESVTAQHQRRSIVMQFFAKAHRLFPYTYLRNACCCKFITEKEKNLRLVQKK